jgi:hypothetical protein
LFGLWFGFTAVSVLLGSGVARRSSVGWEWGSMWPSRAGLLAGYGPVL